MTLYVQNPKEFTKKLLELIVSSPRLPDTKNTQKSTVFLHTISDQSENEIKKFPYNSIKTNKIV